MDIDNPTADPTAPALGMDIEQSLLQQFSCMVTTDHDELVSQLQRLLDKNIDYSTAAFFLDMNNWNLQAAICSYLDIETPHMLPSMRLLLNPETCERICVEPNFKFKQTWLVSNNGTENWPNGCYATEIQSNNSTTLSQQVHGGYPVPSLIPGANYRLDVELISPSKIGVYQNKWRLCTPDGLYFGDEMWVIVEVMEECTNVLTRQLSVFRELGGLPPDNPPTNPFEMGKGNDETGMY